MLCSGKIHNSGRISSALHLVSWDLWPLPQGWGVMGEWQGSLHGGDPADFSWCDALVPLCEATLAETNWFKASVSVVLVGMNLQS